MKSKLFAADQFTDTKFDSAAEKAKFANQFVNFVQSEFSRALFPAWFYRRLSNTFGHIAHYNQAGFYQYFFDNDVDKSRFVQECLRYPCYGEPDYTYCDVEKALQAWMIKENIEERCREKAEASVTQGEMALYRSLKEKYGDLEDD